MANERSETPYGTTKEQKLEAIQKQINSLIEQRERIMRGEDVVQQEKQ
jgi:hypothetical protein